MLSNRFAAVLYLVAQPVWPTYLVRGAVSRHRRPRKEKTVHSSYHRQPALTHVSYVWISQLEQGGMLKRVTTEKRYSVLWEESSEAFPTNDLD